MTHDWKTISENPKLQPHQKAFIQKMGPVIESALVKTGSDLPVEGVLAQVALESGWGKSDLAAVHNNYGGIKHFEKDGWEGPTVAMESYEKNRTEKRVSNFRVYDSPEAYAIDKIKFLDKPRYTQVHGTGTPFDYALELGKAGYHDDDDFGYAQQVNSIATGIFTDKAGEYKESMVAAARTGRINAPRNPEVQEAIAKGERTAVTSFEPTEEDRKNRKTEMDAFLATLPAKDRELFVGIMVVLLFLAGDKEGALAMLNSMGAGGVIQNDSIISNGLASAHNRAQSNPDYNGHASQALDDYQTAASKITNGQLHPQKGQPATPYTPLPPVDVPVTEMTQNFSVNGGKIDIVRDGQLVSNTNAQFAKYQIEVCKKAEADRAKLPDDAPGVTLSTAHFYTNGTQGARLANGVWEHERSAYKNDILRSIYTEAGVKTHNLQENIRVCVRDVLDKDGNPLKDEDGNKITEEYDQLAEIANGDRKLMDYPIKLKSIHADRDNALYAPGQHFTQETHFNGIEGKPSANGYEIIHTRNGASEATIALAARFTKEQPRHVDVSLRPDEIITGEYGFPNNAKSPVFLTEDGFCTNGRDAKNLASAESTYKSAYADAKAGLKYFLQNGAKLQDCKIVRECIDEMVAGEGANKETLVAQLRPAKQEAAPAPVLADTATPETPSTPAAEQAPASAPAQKGADVVIVANENYLVTQKAATELEKSIEGLPTENRAEIVAALDKLTASLKSGSSATPAEGERPEIESLTSAFEKAGIKTNEVNAAFFIVKDADDALSGNEKYSKYSEEVLAPIIEDLKQGKVAAKAPAEEKKEETAKLEDAKSLANGLVMETQKERTKDGYPPSVDNSVVSAEKNAPAAPSVAG